MSTTEIRVRYAETDQMGFAHHASYLIWCEVGRLEFMRELGTSYREMELGGAMLVVARASLDYLAPARFDDIIRIRTWLRDVGSRKVIFEYLLTNSETGERLATARTTLLCIDRAGKIARLPNSVLSLLNRALAAEGDSA